MTDTQRNALKIVIEAVVSGASNGYTVKIDDIVTVIEGIIEKETQFVPGLYPNDYKTIKPCPPGDGNIPPPYPGNPILWDQMADQIVYTYNSTASTDVNSSDIQMICEKNPIKPIERKDNF